MTAVIRAFAEVLVGEDPTSIDRVLRRLRAISVYASPGLVFHAINGIECALLDAIGKRYGHAGLADPGRQVSRPRADLRRLPRRRRAGEHHAAADAAHAAVDARRRRTPSAGRRSA